MKRLLEELYWLFFLLVSLYSLFLLEMFYYPNILQAISPTDDGTRFADFVN